MTTKLLQAVQCTPSNASSTCWKIRLNDQITKRTGIEFHVKVGDTFHKANLNAKGESILFTADAVTHDSVYFDLKILPDYHSFFDYQKDVYAPQKDGPELVPMIWGKEDTVLAALNEGGGCATRLSYLLNRMLDCKYTYPRLINDPDLRDKWAKYATANPVPGFKSHAINSAQRTYIGGDSYEPVAGTIYKPGEKTQAKTKKFNYISSVKQMVKYLSVTYPDAPNVQYGNYNWKGGNAKKERAGIFDAPDDAYWIGVAVRDTGHGHADISGGGLGVDWYAGSETEINYWKFSKVEADGVVPDPSDGSQAVCFKHVLQKNV